MTRGARRTLALARPLSPSRTHQLSPSPTLTLTLSLAVACGSPQPTPCEPSPETPAEAAVESEPLEYRFEPPSAEAGERYFAESGMGDPYYAGIAYPVFLGLLALYPDQLGADMHELEARFGFLADPDARDDPWAVPIGFHLTTDPNTHVPFVVATCTICHAGELALPDGPRVVPGLGNPRLRIHAYDRALLAVFSDDGFTEERLLRAATRAARERGITWPDDWAAAIVRETVRAARERVATRHDGAERIGDGLPGRVATIESFIVALRMQHAADVPFPDGAIGWAKIPDVSPYRWRETISFDAATVGDPAALIAEADFAFGVRTRWIEEHRHIAVSVHLFLRSFERSLDFPGAIDRALADRGHAAFETRCAGCHGHYARDGALLQYRERVVPLEVVETDATRALAVTDAFASAVDALPDSRGLTHTRRTGGYVPPPLVDIWARAPYGHAGQWPTLAVVATAPAERPERIVVAPSGPYDLDAVGLAWRDAGDTPPTSDEHLYDGTRDGYRVGGHPFLSDAPTAERRAILEFLRRL